MVDKQHSWRMQLAVTSNAMQLRLTNCHTQGSSEQGAAAQCCMGSSHLFKLQLVKNKTFSDSGGNRTRQHHHEAPPAEQAGAATLTQPLPQTEDPCAGNEGHHQGVAPNLALSPASCLRGLRGAGPRKLQTAADPIWVLAHIMHMQQCQSLACSPGL